MKYRKKPVVIEAFQFLGKNSEFPGWFINSNKVTTEEDYCLIKTLEGTHRADLNDFIIKGIKGELYPCKPDIFEKTYDKV